MSYRLLMLNYEFPPIGGGAGNAHLCLLRQYADNSDMRIDVLTSAPKPGLFTESFSKNITIYKVGLHKKDLHFWRRVEVVEWLLKARPHYRRLLRENDYDLVHAFFGFPTAWLCYRSRDKLLYIISLRGSDVPGYNIRLGLDYKLTAGLFRRIWSGAAAVVANSEGLRKLALEFMPTLDIGIIPNGIDTEKYYPSQKQELAKPIKVLTVCRLISRKRIDLLVKAAGQARELGLDVQLNIAGEGNLMEALKKLANRLKVADRVVFMGRVPVEQMPQVYRDNDIFVMSSEHEGMSNAMLEAMASGLPIITTRCEGVEELITDNGIIVETPGPRDIAAAIKELIQQPQTYSSMSAASRKRAEMFSWSSVASRYLQCYYEVLKRSRAQPPA